MRGKINELRRVTDATNVEEDKVVMMHEARNMEARAAAAAMNAAEKCANVSKEMRTKLEKLNRESVRDVEVIREKVTG